MQMVLGSQVDGVELTALGLVCAVNSTVDEGRFEEVFQAVMQMSKASHWLLGDTLNLADRRWGNRFSGSKYAEAEQLTGLENNTLRKIASVCSRVPLSARKFGLSFAHHQAAIESSSSIEECTKHLAMAEESKLSSRAFRKEMRLVKAEKEMKKAWEEGESNLDRPFGLLDTKTIDESPDYPLARELTKVSAWFENRDLRKIKPEHRKLMLEDLEHIFRDGIKLLELEMAANPDYDPNLPFLTKK